MLIGRLDTVPNHMRQRPPGHRYEGDLETFQTGLTGIEKIAAARSYITTFFTTSP